MILQLSPYLPFWHVPTGQNCEAFLALDYGKDDDLVLGVILRDGRIFMARTPDLRGVENLTFGRQKTEAALVLPDTFGRG